jgi:hypothetical protein
MEDYNITGFPSSFVPTGFCYSWSSNPSQSTGAFMRSLGVQLCTNPFDITTFDSVHSSVRDRGGGFDHGLLVIDRGRYADRIPYNAVAQLPSRLPLATEAIVGIHFVNMLAQEPPNNAAVVDSYAAYFEAAAAAPGRVLSRNSAELASQWLHRAYTEVAVRRINRGDGRKLTITINAGRMPSCALPMLGPLILQLTPTAVHTSGEQSAQRHLRQVSMAGDETARPLAVWQQAGHWFLSVQLASEHAELQVTLGDRPSTDDKASIRSWWPVAVSSAHEQSPQPLLLRTTDTMVLHGLTETAGCSCAVATLQLDCTVYGQQSIHVQLGASRSKNSHRFAVSTNNASVRVVNTAPVAVVEGQGTRERVVVRIELSVDGRFANGQRCLVQVSEAVCDTILSRC